MTTSDEFGTWMQDAFATLPAQKAHAFRSIWDRRLLTVNGAASVCDAIDQQSAALVWSALQQD